MTSKTMNVLLRQLLKGSRCIASNRSLLLERDENSRAMPGKKDANKVELDQIGKNAEVYSKRLLEKSISKIYQRICQYQNFEDCVL